MEFYRFQFHVPFFRWHPISLRGNCAGPHSKHRHHKNHYYFRYKSKHMDTVWPAPAPDSTVHCEECAVRRREETGNRVKSKCRLPFTIVYLIIVIIEATTPNSRRPQARETVINGKICTTTHAHIRNGNKFFSEFQFANSQTLTLSSSHIWIW